MPCLQMDAYIIEEHRYKSYPNLSVIFSISKNPEDYFLLFLYYSILEKPPAISEGAEKHAAHKVAEYYNDGVVSLCTKNFTTLLS